METSIPKIKEQFEVGPCESLTVAEMVEKVDELVNKVISLETAFSSQEALIQRLRTETDELQAQIQTLEDDKATLIHGKNDLRNKLMEMEEKFHGIQDLNQSVEDQNNNLQTHFTEAHSNIDHLSEKVHSMKPGEKLEIEKSSSGEAKSSKEEEIGDSGKMPKEVKAGKEFVVKHASERENSPAEVKSSKESEEQERRNLDASDGCKSLQSAKQAMVVVSDSLSREEDCVVKVSSTKEPEERGEKLDHSDGCTKGGHAESEVRKDLKLEKREEAEEHDSVRTSTDKGGVHYETSKPSEKCEDLIVENKVDEQTPLLIVDNTLVNVESKEQERRLEDASKGGDTEPKAREDLKREEREEAEEHDSVRTSTNEGEDKVDKQAPLLTVDVVAKVGSKDQERGQEDEPKGGDTEPKTREDLKLEEEKDAEEHDSVRTSTNEGGVHHETSEPSERHEDQVAEDEVDKQAPLLTMDAVAKVGSKDQERGQEDESKGGVHHETFKPSEKCENLIAGNKVDKQASFLTMDAVAKVGSKDQERGEEDEPDWKQLFSKGMGDRERTLLTKYTMALRKYKEVKKKLVEVEANNQNMLFDIMLQLKELKSHNAMKDEEIRSLHQKLSLLQTSIAEINSTDQYVDPRISTEKPVVTETSIAPAHKEEGNEPTVMNQPPTMSAIEAKFRMNIDALLEENLEFWFRFGTAFHEVQKFENGVKDLVGEEIQHEVTLWVENSASLKELKKRFSSLCEIQEEITKALKASAEDDDFSFTSYQAVKFQGEILNMKQENNKVADELQAGYNRVTALQIEIERSLARLSDDWDLSGSKSHQSSEPQQSHSRSGVPLRSFIFGAKLKKQKASIFSFVQPTLHRKFSSSRSGNQ
ncbi:protein NETWORKED 2D-like [Gossypium australe]|uniref:Protein NETWORKED 2D-like n=1 Tax=Gossypium australe TaxID=47621 RepID=A0A5B6V4P9_9ROSI|nr:protein NETWORKED 2D-like [Gossypium australe]